MTRSFSSFALRPDQTALVFPLVRAAVSGVDLETWQGHVRSLGDGMPSRPSGTLGLRNEAGYVCGLLVFRVDQDLRHGRVLAISLFIALDLVNEEEAAGALLQAAEAKARELRCAAMHIRLDAAQKSLMHRFAAAGYRNEVHVFCRRMESGPLPS
jgi:hypothetical protein